MRVRPDLPRRSERLLEQRAAESQRIAAYAGKRPRHIEAVLAISWPPQRVRRAGSEHRSVPLGASPSFPTALRPAQ